MQSFKVGVHSTEVSNGIPNEMLRNSENPMFEGII